MSACFLADASCLTDALDRQKCFIPASGRYQANLTAGSLKITESRIIAGLLLDGIDKTEWKKVTVSENALKAKNPATAVRLARLIRQRMETVLSFAIGCMMGRYSLDKPALVYAHNRNEGFDPNQYRTFPADTDGIIPITELTWFSDDATERFVEFIAKAWPRERLEENLKFITDSLGSNRDEHPRDTIRRYLGTRFYKDHLSTYKKRPIYWLFSSGKHQSFQCLVYLHRYHEGTLARMRTEYVIPLHRARSLIGLTS